MKFIVTKEACGNVFFSAPTMREMKKADEKLSDICHERLKDCFGNQESSLTQLEKELCITSESCNSFQYLVLKEIADCSRELGYPVQSNNGTLIAYLLGISYINPLSDCFCSQPCGILIADSTGMRIAAPVRSVLQERLDKALGNTKDDKNNYKHISLPDSEVCQNIGDAHFKVHIPEKNISFNKDVYKNVMKKISSDIISDVRCDDKQKSFANELLNMPIESFCILLRAYGYLFNTTESEKSVERIKDFRYCVLRDEVYDMLVQKGLPPKEAVRFCRGLMSEKLKTEYFELKARYNLQDDEALQDFEQTKYYFTSSAGANFLFLACEKETLSI